jgi:hypothetical protein
MQDFKFAKDSLELEDDSDEPQRSMEIIPEKDHCPREDSIRLPAD